MMYWPHRYPFTTGYYWEYDSPSRNVPRNVPPEPVTPLFSSVTVATRAPLRERADVTCGLRLTFIEDPL